MIFAGEEGCFLASFHLRELHDFKASVNSLARTRFGRMILTNLNFPWKSSCRTVCSIKQSEMLIRALENDFLMSCTELWLSMRRMNLISGNACFSIGGGGCFLFGEV